VSIEGDLWQAKVLAMSDQLWKDAEESLADFRRIGFFGPDGSDRDANLVKVAAMMVASEIYMRAAMRRDAD
jgi:hypothetical protein